MNNVSAVIGVFFNQEGKILTIENTRGIDVPGGHVKHGETIRETIIRELLEEGGAVVRNIRIIDILTSRSGDYKDMTMVFVTGEVDSFDEEKARMMTIEEFLKVYSQDKGLMLRILEKAKNAHHERKI